MRRSNLSRRCRQPWKARGVGWPSLQACGPHVCVCMQVCAASFSTSWCFCPGCSSKKKAAEPEQRVQQSAAVVKPCPAKVARPELQQQARETLRKIPDSTHAVFLDGARRKKRLLDPRTEHLAAQLSRASVMMVKSGSAVCTLTPAETSLLHGCSLDFSLCTEAYARCTLAGMTSAPSAGAMLLLACQACGNFA